MDSIFTCTACAVSFSTSDAHKLHYKLDWHRYNLRRKVAALGPVDQDDFDKRLSAALGSNAPKAEFHGRCKECRKSFRSEGLYTQHLQSKKHKEAIKIREATSVPAAPDADGSGGGAPVAAVASSAAAAAGTASVGGGTTEGGPAVISSSPTSAGGPLKIGVEAQPEATEDQMDVDSGEEEEEDGGEELVPPRMGLRVCIFCNLESASFEENCQHMLHRHGFFIPDVEYLVDPEGLFRYIEAKVKLGNICIYCNGKGKTFHTYRSVQQHMMDRAHCKLLYDEDEDLHEYETFYDFSSSYLNAEKEGLVAGTGGAAGAVDANFETNEAGGDSDDDDVEVTRTLGVTDLGELVLLDGKTVGNRKWSRYYKQRLRTPDEREAVVAQRRATRLQLGAMYDDEMRKGTSTGNAVALQRGQRKAFGGLSGVSRPKDVKMLRAHQRNQARQRLKTEIRQNKLNKTFDRVAEM